MFFEAVFWGGLGLILGSFANVLILRHGIRGLGGRSACPDCKTTLKWFELVPVLSWIALKGRCRSCGKRISMQYPLVELAMCALTLGIGLSPVPLTVRVIGVAVVLLCIALAAYDMRHTVLPDSWVYGFVACALFLGAFSLPDRSAASISLFMLTGPAVALPLFSLWYFSGGKWMGFGDVKFAIGMGYLLGFIPGYVALCIAFVAGAIVGLVLLYAPRMLDALRAREFTPMDASHKSFLRFTMKSEVPFGPFLIIGVCIVWLSELHGFPLLDALGDFLSLS